MERKLKFILKKNATWVEYSKGYRKINGVWVEQDLDVLFDNTMNYIHG